MIRLKVRDKGWVVQLELLLYLAVLLSDVCLYLHLTGAHVNMHVKNARTSLHEFWAKRCEASLATMGKIDAPVGSPEVTAVITSCTHPLDRTKLLDLAE